MIDCGRVIAGHCAGTDGGRTGFRTLRGAGQGAGVRHLTRNLRPEACRPHRAPTGVHPYGPGILDLTHQPDEYVVIDDLVSSAKVMTHATLNLLGIA